MDTTTTQPLVVTPQDRPRPLDVVGEHVTVLASGAQTQSYEIFLQAGPDGSGPPPHSHPWDEAFFVVRGEIAFGIDGSETAAGPGTFVQVPRGATHWFRFGAGGGEMLSVTSCAGASKFFTDLDANIASDAPDLGRLIEIANAHAVSVAAPPG